MEGFSSQICGQTTDHGHICECGPDCGGCSNGHCHGEPNPFEPRDDNEHEEEAVKVLSRADAVASKGIKRPMRYAPEPPDLGRFFEDFEHLSDKEVITICRSYASYLSSIQPKRKKRAAPKK